MRTGGLGALALAAFGLVICAAAAAVFALAGASYGVVAFFAVLAVIAVADLAAIVRRRLR